MFEASVWRTPIAILVAGLAATAVIASAAEEPTPTAEPEAAAVEDEKGVIASAEDENTPPAEPEPEAGEASVMDQIRSYIDEKKSAGAIDTDRSNWRTRLPRFPEVSFDEGTTYYWNLKTNVGDITIKFLQDVAPNHVANYLYLTQVGFFDGLKFHRVIQGFMAQGGCPLGTGTGGPGYEFDGEFDASTKHGKPGLLSMANRGPGTDGSQFFLTFKQTPWLDGRHTIFGEVTDGMDTVRALEERGSPDGSGRTSEPLVLTSAQITTD